MFNDNVMVFSISILTLIVAIFCLINPNFAIRVAERQMNFFVFKNPKVKNVMKVAFFNKYYTRGMAIFVIIVSLLVMIFNYLI